MTINIPDGVITDASDIDGDARPSPEERNLAMWAMTAHPMDRERVLRSRLNDPDRRDEFIAAAVFGDNVHDLFWYGHNATDVVGGASPIPLHVGNFTFPTPSYTDGLLERWPKAVWSAIAKRFASDESKRVEIVRRRLRSHPGEFTRLDTLKAKGGDYGAPDWVHDSGDPAYHLWEMDYAHAWQRIV